VDIVSENKEYIVQYRKIAVGMIEATYDAYKNYWSVDGSLYTELNKFNIPVWNKMSSDTKRAAIEYVYQNRDTIELHSDMVESWVQATAYFMIMNFAFYLTMDEEPEIEIFFDDMDFMMDEDVLADVDVQEQMGINKDFTNKF
jgi:hypothetical protein